jgi:hypothetical protein
LIGIQGGGASAAPINIAGSVTASFSQFAPNGNYTQLPVGPSSARFGLPGGAGSTIGVYNIGTNAAFVRLGTSTVAATGVEDQVAPGGFQCFAVGSNTFIAAVETAGPTTLNVSGGNGGCAGSGGGGGGSGGGGSGNVFQATAFSTGTASAAATTQVIAASGTTTAYLVNYAYQTDASASGNGTFQIISGTGTNCATVHQSLTPVWSFAQNSGISEGSIGVLGQSNASDAICVVTTSTQKVNWRIGVAQQ